MKRYSIKLLTVIISGVILTVCPLFLSSDAAATVPGINSLISANSTGANSNSSGVMLMQNRDISGDGQHVVFTSSATNIVSGDTDSYTDVFVRDVTANTTTMASVSSTGAMPNANATYGSISYGGNYVVFQTAATNIVSGVTSGVPELYLHNMQTGTTQLVSSSAAGVAGDQPSKFSDVSSDGRYVAFASASTNLVSTSSYGQQVFLKDMQTGAVQEVSLNASGTVGDGTTSYLSMSCDGSVIAFSSTSTNLVPGDTNGNQDVFVATAGWSGSSMKDISLGGNGNSLTPEVSCDGNAMIFFTAATNLPGRATAGELKYDRSTDAMQAIVGGQNSTLSDDGRYVASDSGSSAGDVYLLDTITNTIQTVDVNSSGGAVGNCSIPKISADARYIAYYCQNNSYPTHRLIPTETSSGSDVYESVTGI